MELSRADPTLHHHDNGSRRTVAVYSTIGEFPSRKGVRYLFQRRVDQHFYRR